MINDVSSKNRWLLASKLKIAVSGFKNVEARRLRRECESRLRVSVGVFEEILSLGEHVWRAARLWTYLRPVSLPSARRLAWY